MENIKHSESYTLPRSVAGLVLPSKLMRGSPALVPLLGGGGAPLVDASILHKSRPPSADPPHYSSAAATATVASGDGGASTSGSLTSLSTKLRLRYAFHSLILTAISAVFFSLLSLARLDTLERLAVNISATPRNHVHRVVWEASMSASLATLLASTATFFISIIHLFFALKIAKSNPGSTILALRYLESGKLIRLPTLFIFILSTLIFIIAQFIAIVVVPTPLGVLPRGIVCAIGLTLSIFCSLAAIHSVHSLFRLDNHALGFTASNAFAPSTATFGAHYSTLV